MNNGAGAAAARAAADGCQLCCLNIFPLSPACWLTPSWGKLRPGFGRGRSLPPSMEIWPGDDSLCPKHLLLAWRERGCSWHSRGVVRNTHRNIHRSIQRNTHRNTHRNTQEHTQEHTQPALPFLGLGQQAEPGMWGRRTEHTWRGLHQGEGCSPGTSLLEGSKDSSQPFGKLCSVRIGHSG